MMWYFHGRRVTRSAFLGSSQTDRRKQTNKSGNEAVRQSVSQSVSQSASQPDRETAERRVTVLFPPFLRPHSQRFGDVAVALKLYLKCGVAKSFRMGPLLCTMAGRPAGRQ